MSAPEKAADPLDTRAQVCARLGISRATSYRLEKTGHLPRPVRISERVVRWRRSEIDAFLARLAADRGGQP